jgi:hypothetical protein
MRPVPALALVAVAAGVAWWIVRPRPAGAPPVPDVPAARAPEVPEPTAGKAAGTLGRGAFDSETGVLVVRVRTSDGSLLPEKTLAGFTPGSGGARLRPVVEGVARFPDAPLGRLEATAEAEGYAAAPTAVVVLAGVPAEAVVVLSPQGKPK